ncbi:hypothetical protein AK812_SmicGene10322 [Symbiodinium microadriaticum]|uniref:Uncharacterized protein n=1 Tax=Symbiodinium microadriaticum TaxID=2951 RepID=A0A1Q9EG07_SYMMI|nr:hypothetical protein AK812_SmicGene10322 [Symbiodinium microadriaticum]
MLEQEANQVAGNLLTPFFTDTLSCKDAAHALGRLAGELSEQMDQEYTALMASIEEIQNLMEAEASTAAAGGELERYLTFPSSDLALWPAVCDEELEAFTVRIEEAIGTSKLEAGHVEVAILAKSASVGDRRRCPRRGGVKIETVDEDEEIKVLAREQQILRTYQAGTSIVSFYEKVESNLPSSAKPSVPARNAP